VSDFFVAGSWRNREAIAPVVDVLDAHGLDAYCFIREPYPPVVEELAKPGGADAAPLDSPAVKELFERDLAALRATDRFLVVFPAGQAAHVEAGIAYGLGKPCYAVGPIERSETLYRIFERVFATPDELARWLERGGGGVVVV
jgi:hypothetical protein